MEKTKVVVLDTNVLVDNPKAIIDFEDCLVVVPQIVIEELDGLKNSRDGSKRAVVRRASWLIDEITEEHADKEYMPIGKDSYLFIDGNYTCEYDTIEPSKPDNIIISSAVRFAKDRSLEVIMYSNDVNVRAITRSVARKLGVGLVAKRYEILGRSLHEIDSGVQTLYLDYRQVNALRQDNYLNIELPYVNGEHLIVTDKENIKNAVLAQYDAIMKKVISLPDYKKGPTVLWGSGDDAVRPRDSRQTFLAHDILNPNKHIHFVLSRVAGAGKNYITTACALRLLKDGLYDKLMIVKPMIDIEGQGTGYLPGSKEEKLAPWFQSFDDTMYELTSGQLEYELEEKIELDVVTHMRGRSIPNTIFIIDEAQNFSEESIKTMLTRAGKNTKIILTGDLSQIDNPRLDADNNGLRIWAERARNNQTSFDKSTYILLDSNFRSDLSAWASSFYE